MNAWALIVNIILYRTISKDFAEKLVLKMKGKLCKERRFGVLKTLKNQELPGALPLGPRPGHCPWTPPGALERAPGPPRCEDAPLYLDINNFYSAPRSNKSCTRPWYVSPQSDLMVLAFLVLYLFSLSGIVNTAIYQMEMITTLIM